MNAYAYDLTGLFGDDPEILALMRQPDGVQPEKQTEEKIFGLLRSEKAK